MPIMSIQATATRLPIVCRLHVAPSVPERHDHGSLPHCGVPSSELFEVGGGWLGSMSRPRPPRLTWPPLRPADRASSAVHSWAVPFSCAARPPLLAISRCFSGDMDANPRRSFRSVVTVTSRFCCLLSPVRDHKWPLVIKLRRRVAHRHWLGFVERCVRCLVPIVVSFVLALVGIFEANGQIRGFHTPAVNQNRCHEGS